ncbi:MAG: hypothetical protein CMF31_10715 [Kordiimonas sp.]|nr:hypothetical protein [Kordiimonas sp.]|tara:strand:+ start:2643 stop:3074 length:432 start_codon:yes stop_codon:yes gene_type:complete
MATSYYKLDTILRDARKSLTETVKSPPFTLDFIWQNQSVYAEFRPTDDPDHALLDLKVALGPLPYRAENAPLRFRLKRLLLNPALTDDGHYRCSNDNTVIYRCQTKVENPKSIGEVIRSILITLYATKEKTLDLIAETVAGPV